MNVLLAAARLGEAADLRPAQANLEQRRRAALARALSFDPDLVIMEQPFSGLTNKVALELFELVRGGDVPLGSRRTVLALSANVPDVILPRFEHRYRMTVRGLRTER